MKNRLTSRHLRIAFFAMLVILVAALLLAPVGVSSGPSSTATGRSTATTTRA